MATTHHMSVIANSCVKPPVNPQTGLSATINERSGAMLADTWRVTEAFERGEYEDDAATPTAAGRHVGLFDKTDSIIGNLTADLGHLSDDAFYQRLLELKNEHRQTLDLCEKMYTEKVGYPYYGTPFSNGVAMMTTTELGGERAVPDRRLFGYDSAGRWDGMDGGGVRASLDPSLLRDSVRDMSRPPTGRPAGPRPRPQSAMAAGAVVPPAVRASSDFEMAGGGRAQTDPGAWSEDEWRPLSAASSELDYPNGGPDDSRNTALSHIEDMWDNFSVEEYAPPRGRPRSASLSRVSVSSSAKTKNKKDTIDWRHKITLPKPFSMTLRESAKARDKTRSQLDFERRKNEEERRDEEECQKKFKAKPVPAHVYMPLFDEKIEEMESRRKYIRENSKELLKSKEQPFNFMKREEERRKYRHKKCETNNKEAAKAEIERQPPTKFKARPFPAHIFDNSTLDKLQEEEEYRKIRVQMRAEELLQSSTLPPNMAARGKEYTEGKSRQKMYAERAKKAGITAEHKFKPKIKGTIPDFDELHRKVQKEMSQRKGGKEATVCKPFKLRTKSLSSKRHQIYEDICHDEESIKENKWPFRSTRSKGLDSMRTMSTSMDSIPARMTASSELRASTNRARLQQNLDAQLEELERERRRRLKEKKLKKYIAERALVNDHSVDLEHSLKTKLKEYKESQRSRKEEYRRTLNEINERVEKRPLLFERTIQANAKKAAEKKYREVLEQAGLDEDYIASKGSGATDADLEAVSDGEDDYQISCPSSRRGSTRSRSHSVSESRRYSSEFDGLSESDRTPDGSDVDA